MGKNIHSYLFNYKKLTTISLTIVLFIVSIHCLNAAEAIVQIDSFHDPLWQTYASTRGIQKIEISDNGKKIWVGTYGGGLIERELPDGKVINRYQNELPENVILSLLKDGHGGLWIGTTNGLVHKKVDETWEIFNALNSGLLSSVINALLPDSKGGVWIGDVEGNIVHFDVNGKWDVLNLDCNSGDGIVQALISDGRGGFWIGLDTGLIHHSDNNTCQYFDSRNSSLPVDDVTALLLDNAGGLWIGTFDGGLVYLNKSGSMQVYNKSNSDLPHNIINVITSDNNQGIWVGTSFGFTHFINGSFNYVFGFDEVKEYFSDTTMLSIYSIALNYDGGLWLGTSGGLVYRSKEGIVKRFKIDSDDLPANVNSLVSDKKSGIWLGMDAPNNLLHLAADASIIQEMIEYKEDYVSLSEFISVPVNTLLADEYGGLWIGTKEEFSNLGGLVYHNSENGIFKYYNSNKSELPDNNIQALFDDGIGGLWIGTGGLWQSDKLIGGGLAYLDEDGFISNIENVNITNKGVNTIISDNRGGIWIGTRDAGLVHYSENEDWDVLNSDNSELPFDTVTSLLPDGKGGIWIGTMPLWWAQQYYNSSDGGLAHLTANGDWQVLTSDNSELLDNWVYSLASDRNGGFWIGTWEGLNRLDSSGQWTSYQVDNSGLRWSEVSSLLPDESGGLWIGSRFGLAHFSRLGSIESINKKGAVRLIKSQPHY